MGFFYYFGILCFGAFTLFAGLVAFYTVLEIINRYNNNKYRDTEKYWRKHLSEKIRDLMNSRFVNYSEERDDGYVPTKFGLFIELIAGCIEHNRTNWGDTEGLTLDSFAEFLQDNKLNSEKDEESYIKEEIITLICRQNPDKNRKEIKSYVDRVFDEDKGE